MKEWGGTLNMPMMSEKVNINRPEGHLSLFNYNRNALRITVMKGV